MEWLNDYRQRWVLCGLVCLGLSTLASAGVAAEHRVLYVEGNSAGARDGTTWADAYDDLQDALAAALVGDEVWVAEGRYVPSVSAQTATFQLKSGVGLYGGFSGTEDQRGQRDPVANKTILSGDLRSNDVEVSSPLALRGHVSRLDNSFHVVTGSGADGTAVLDGFTISGGNAVGSGKDGSGGGLFNVKLAPRESTGRVRNGPSPIGGEPTVKNCTFEWNLATVNGGGLYNDGGNMTLINCTFQYNYALGVSDWSGNDWPFGGAGMYTQNADPMLTNCTFRHNMASRAAGLYNVNGSPTLFLCTFHANIVPIAGSRAYGGAVFNSGSGSNPFILNCSFVENESRIGGGFYNQLGATPTLVNCLFARNSALRVNATGDGGRGGGLQNWQSHSQLINCTLTENVSDNSAAGLGAWGGGSQPTVTNCIFWNNRIENPSVSTNGSIAQINGADPFIVAYSCIQGGWSGGRGNINEDPLFVDPENGDFRLKSQAGYWHTTSQSWVIDDVTSPCIDAGNPMDAIGLEPFPTGGFLNMGAYGGTAQASKAYFGEAPCDAIMAGDINGDCQVDRVDLEIMALHWTDDVPLE